MHKKQMLPAKSFAETLGGNTKRPKFQEMMERCRNGEFQLVICYRLDRISRNTSDFVNTYEELKEHSVFFVRSATTLMIPCLWAGL